MHTAPRANAQTDHVDHVGDPLGRESHSIAARGRCQQLAGVGLTVGRYREISTAANAQDRAVGAADGGERKAAFFAPLPQIF